MRNAELKKISNLQCAIDNAEFGMRNAELGRNKQCAMIKKEADWMN